jgi:hypothetical protein
MRLFLVFLLAAVGSGGAFAQGLVGMEKQILPLTKDSWLAFRNYDGQQLVYFTHLVVYRCGLSEIRYSINSDALDHNFALSACDPERPNEVPADDLPYLSLPLGSAQTMDVQIVYSDGEESQALRFAPCDNAGDGTCAKLVE